MEVALGSLRDEGASVGELAHRLGYQSEAAFARAFKRVMGGPPRRSDGVPRVPGRQHSCRPLADRRLTYAFAGSNLSFARLRSAGTRVGYSRVKHARQTEPSGSRVASCIPASER